jgi:hypothetical protein
MQAQALRQWRHPRLNHVVGLGLILGLVVSLAFNVVMLDRVRDDNVSAVTVRPAETAYLALQQRYYEAKMDRLDALEAAIGAQYVAALSPDIDLDRQENLYYDQMERDWLPKPKWTPGQRQQLIEQSVESDGP